MSKKIMALLAFWLMCELTFACDLCSIYIGLNPNGSKNSFSIRHRYRSFEKDYFLGSYESINNSSNRQFIKGLTNDKHGVDGEPNYDNGKFTLAEKFNSYDITANFFLNDRLQLNLSAFFADNYVLHNDSITANIGGLGDISFILKYQLFNTKKSNDTLKNKFLHRIIVGSGINLPTGSFNKKSVTGFETEIQDNRLVGIPVEELDPHIQAGAGSLSYLILLEYMAKFNKLGFNGNMSYRLNTTNKNGFRFANRFNTNGSLFFLTNILKKVRIMPNIGGSFEMSQRDQQTNQDFLGSGGKVLFLNSGISLFINKIAIDFSHYLPVYENLLDDQPFNKDRIITQLTYYF